MKNKVIYIILFIVLFGISIFFLNYTIENLEYASEVNKILSDDLEIEKKWLVDVDAIPYNLETADIERIEQTYICFSPEIRVRRINEGQRYTFAVKTGITEDGMIRNELEEEIKKKNMKVWL